MKKLQDIIIEKLKLDKDSKSKRIDYYIPKTLVELNKYIDSQKEKSHMTHEMYGTKDYPVDLSYIDFSLLANQNNESLSYLFYGDTDILYLDMSNCKFGNMLSIDHMFNDTQIKEINISNWDLGEISILTGLFEDCRELQKIYGIENLDMSKITRISSMFNHCVSLTDLDLSKWDLSNTIRLVNIFNECTSLKTLDLSDWYQYSHNFIKCAKMFKNCCELQTIKGIENWNLVSCDTISRIFINCEKLNINIDNWKIKEDMLMEDSFVNTNIHPKWYA